MYIATNFEIYIKTVVDAPSHILPTEADSFLVVMDKLLVISWIIRELTVTLHITPQPLQG